MVAFFSRATGGDVSVSLYAVFSHARRCAIAQARIEGHVRRRPVPGSCDCARKRDGNGVRPTGFRDAVIVGHGVSLSLDTRTVKAAIEAKARIRFRLMRWRRS